MRTKALLKFGLISLLVVTASIFGFRTVGALNLPVEAGLGQTCDASTPCEGRFFCSGGRCVQCVNSSACETSLNESCIDYVCTLPGGNNAGDLCANDSNCKSGLACGVRGVCEEVSGFKKAFNYSCQSTADCASSLSCLNGGCVECVTIGDCGSNATACEQGACVLAGGNPEGAWCAKDSHCASGECSEGNICQAAAAGPAGQEGGEWDWTGVDITIEDVANIIEGLACWLTRIATAIMVIFLVLAGLRFMNARGNPAAYQLAMKNFQYVLIGILVIMAVYVIIATVAYAVGRTDFSLIPLVC